MKTVNLLLGNSEGRVNNLIEALMRDVCDNHAIVHSIRTARVDEFIRQGCEGDFDLAIVIPDNLLPDPSRRTALSSIGEAVRAFEAIKKQRYTPIIAVAVCAQYETLLSDAGADCVLELPFNCDQLKEAIRRLLTLSTQQQPQLQEEELAAPRPWSLAGTLMRGWQRLTEA